jgi:hypothetical protein
MTLQEQVLKVLAGQSPGYSIFPNAAAFAAEELDPDEVAAALEVLHEQGLVTRETVFGVEGGQGIPGGYRLIRSSDGEG